MSTAGDHLDRLTAVDASFLTNETSSSHMHVGAILIFEGPPPLYVDLVEHVRGRLSQVPRFRQRLVVPPLEAGRPLWADDVNFNLTYHIRHTGAARAGRRGAAEAARRARLLPAARPLQAALGAVAGAGAGARPLRDPDQDPPRDGRRHLRRRHRHRALRPRAGAGAAARVETTGRRARSRARSSWSRAGPSDLAAAPLKLAERAVEAVRNPETAARRMAEAPGGGRRGGRRLRRPGARRAAEPADRAAPALRLGPLGAGDLQADQGQRSAAPSTTSCWRW